MTTVAGVHIGPPTALPTAPPTALPTVLPALGRPPLAARRSTSAALALREEINDSLRLLVISLGALCAIAVLLVVLSAALG